MSKKTDAQMPRRVVRFRCAKTGEYRSRAYVEANPLTTITERRWEGVEDLMATVSAMLDRMERMQAEIDEARLVLDAQLPDLGDEDE